MLQQIPWLITAVSVTILIIFWFREARRQLTEQKEMLDTATAQWTDFRLKHICDRNDPEIAEIMVRCESIYRQAANHYNETLHKPWILIPGTLMGFREKECNK